MADVSRSLIQKHIEAGAITVDGEAPPRGAKTKVVAGMSIRYVPPPPAPLDLIPQDIPVDIVFEDDDLVVVDKPAGLVVHPALGHPNGTLINALLHHVRDFERATLEDGQPDLRPGIVHRLDKDTSGVMVVAKRQLVQRKLSEAFAERQVKKQYVCVAHGVPSPSAATLDTWHGRHPTDRKRFSSKVDRGKRAVSHYVVKESYPGASLVTVRIETGRTHQIRVHLADIGHPLVGDPIYGRRRRSRDPRVGPIVNDFGRTALHARSLRLQHPVSGKEMTFKADLPKDLVELVDALRRCN